jgi:CspA family cold shock protein
MVETKPYDWAQAVITLAECRSEDVNELVSSASLDPMAGDLSDADFSNLDLSGQNLSGWNLRYANLKRATLVGTKLRGTELQNAVLEADQLVQASEWQDAHLSEELRAAAIAIARTKRGKVKWYNPTKGYGFISPDAMGEKDVFVHVSSVESSGLSTLVEGQVIEFVLVTNRGKTSAEELRVLSQESVIPAERISEA